MHTAIPSFPVGSAAVWGYEQDQAPWFGLSCRTCSLAVFLGIGLRRHKFTGSPSPQAPCGCSAGGLAESLIANSAKGVKQFDTSGFFNITVKDAEDEVNVD